MSIFIHLNSIILLLIPYIQSELTPPILSNFSTNGGTLRGRVGVTRGGRYFSQFNAIPYGRILQRFQGAQEVRLGEWEGMMEADGPGPACPQPNPHGGGVEECLTINIATPEFPQNGSIKPEELLPVLVYIHPSESNDFRTTPQYGALYKPNFILDEDVVFVTFNYRFGALGFLNTEDGEIPGNLGFKDQVRALKWLQEHLKAFGGDPEKVTLLGHSHISLHMISPMSKGLFRSAISLARVQSTLTPPSTNPRMTFMMLSNLLRCNRGQNTRGIIDCLRSRPLPQLLQMESNLERFNGEWKNLFGPSVETEKTGSERFLPEDPATAFKDGKSQTPWMFGLDSEYIQRIRGLSVDPYKLQEFLRGSDNSMRSNSRAKSKWKKLLQAVNANDSSTEAIIDRLILEALTPALEHSRAGHETFLFLLGHSQNNSLGQDNALSLLFPPLLGKSSENVTELTTSEELIKAFVSFANESKPIIEHGDWSPLNTSGELRFYNFGGNQSGEISSPFKGKIEDLEKLSWEVEEAEEEPMKEPSPERAVENQEFPEKSQDDNLDILEGNQLNEVDRPEMIDMPGREYFEFPQGRRVGSWAGTGPRRVLVIGHT